MKKLLALTLALVLACSLCVPALADGPDGPMREGHYVVNGQSVPAISQEELESGDFLTINVDELTDVSMSPDNIEVMLPEDLEDFPRVLPSFDDPEPTLTLVVNGQPTDLALTVLDDFVTYADADGLRALLGPRAVGESVTGLIPVRKVAEDAGWDVVWYDGGWLGFDQQVCLWDRAAYTAQLEEATGAFQQFYGKLLDKVLEMMDAQTPQTSTETVDLTFTRFNSLDGNKTYTARIVSEMTMEKGLVDWTLSFNAVDLLRMLTPAELTALLSGTQASMAHLNLLMKNGQAEILMDLNEGAAAINIPLLALIDPDLAGWHGIAIPELKLDELRGMGEQMDLAEAFYESLLSDTRSSGGVEALGNYSNTLAAANAFMGPQCLQVKPDGSMTYTLTTQRVNELFQSVMVQADPTLAEKVKASGVSLFKTYDISMSISKNWDMKVDMDVRMDVDGIADLAAMSADGPEAAGASLGVRLILGLLDFRVTGQASGSLERATERMTFHWKNVGELSMVGQSSTRQAKDHPQKLSEVVPPEAMYDPLGGAFGSNYDLGVIGGADGPTAVFTSGL